ncbi:MAG: hypothetical protein WCY58_13680 [Mariniphaga sp.]|jgi:hypothetical protein|nr:hypothetical protein [Mariniphaga sp.]MDD4227525.1 hypothetical protein [Mariniphaga sp.]
MKKKIKIFIGSVAFITIFILNIANFLDSTSLTGTGMSLSSLITLANADDEGGGEMKHSQVVGCGSKRMEDWEAGCCAGTGGCVDNCNKTPEYCD